MAYSVLVVDDDGLINENLCAYLEDEGCLTHGCESAEEAIELLKTKSFQVGIINMRLPLMSGNELIESLVPLYPNMKFIIHTGATDYQLPKNLCEFGLNEEQVFYKPLSDMKLLIDKIKSLVN